MFTSESESDPEPFVPCSEMYSARRRVQRLSFVVWATICNDNQQLQKVLEVSSTSDRLRLAMRWLRGLREQVESS